MFSSRKGHFQQASLALLLSAGLAAGTYADTLNVMAIGDSLTWGYIKENPNGSSSSSAQSNGGWRVPLETYLNSSSSLSDQFNFVGVRGDNNNNTAPNEVSNPSDEFDGDGATAIALHEGYSGWYIETSNYGGDSASRQGIRDNLTSNGGAIAPQNADIVMLAIGVNDVIGLSSETPVAGNTVSTLVADLGDLIDEIVNLAPESQLFVSTLLPTREDGLFGDTSDRYDNVNSDINAFNTELFSSLFGSTWFDDGDETDAYAQHETNNNVFLLNAFNAIDNGETAGDITGDGIHLTSDGYEKLGLWYGDRFETLAIPEPTSAAVLAVIGGLAMCRRRRA